MGSETKACRLALLIGLLLSVAGLVAALVLGLMGWPSSRTVALGALYVLIVTPAAALLAGAAFGRRLLLAFGIVAVLVLALVLEAVR